MLLSIPCAPVRSSLLSRYQSALSCLLTFYLFRHREYAIADYLENNGYSDALEAFKKDAKIVSGLCFGASSASLTVVCVLCVKAPHFWVDFKTLTNAPPYKVLWAILRLIGKKFWRKSVIWIDPGGFQMCHFWFTSLPTVGFPAGAADTTNLLFTYNVLLYNTLGFKYKGALPPLGGKFNKNQGFEVI